MYLIITILPILASIISGFFGRKVGIKGSQVITCVSALITTLLVLVIFIEVGLNNVVVSIKLFRLLDSELFYILWGFNFDSLTVSMLIPVLIISSLVHVYSVSYMSTDPHNQRFFSYLSLFTWFMIILITSNNYLLMFVGWEGVGVCSYLLVNFWYTRIAANQSSISAFLTNRVGDCFLTIGMFAILWSFGNLDYSTVFSLAPYIGENVITIIGICLLIGAMAKSSQIGLHVWLPLAMEGPTPVSALIHAATMVTAGVYLLMRSSPLIEYSSTVLLLCLWIGAITTLFSSLIGLFQQDIKKVIAYSTMSQLAQEYNKFIIFRHQTICVEIILLIINSQITKVHYYLYNNYVSNNFFNSFFVLWCTMRQYLRILKYTLMSVKWGVITISKLVGISEAIRLILIYCKLTIYNKKIFFFMLTFIVFIVKLFIIFTNMLLYYLKIYYSIANPTTTATAAQATHKKHRACLLSPANYTVIHSSFNNTPEIEALKFNEWLAGLLDGDGYFIITKKGYVSCEITLDIKDKKALYEVKQKYGGTIKVVSNTKALRYKLRHKKGLVALIYAMNGLIRNPYRILQMNRLCVKYDMEIEYAKPLTYNNGWLSGFIDSDGSVYFNDKSGQISISISQKNRFLLEPLISLYGGRIDIVSPNTEAFKYVVYRKNELLDLLDNYFNKYPLKTNKYNRIKLIKEFYPLHKDNSDTNKYKQLILFKDKWEKYVD